MAVDVHGGNGRLCVYIVYLYPIAMAMGWLLVYYIRNIHTII